MQTRMEQEIFSQSTVLNTTYEHNAQLVEAIATLIKQRRFPYIMMAAREAATTPACISSIFAKSAWASRSPSSTPRS
ncbi:MAG: hypothetical protein MZW92_33735 [Comamonadaceae bacterium]|nr:hypothetical protein [Comamonadaceae bacterium]